MSRFPSTLQLLISGEDSRLLLDPDNGKNHYLCRPQPDPDLLKLGSSTATAMSTAGFDIADRLRNQMADEVRRRTPESVYHDHAERIRQEIRICCQAGGDCADEQAAEAVDVILAESGTIAHRQALQIVRSQGLEQSWHVLMADAAETGRGVPSALSPPDGGVLCADFAIRDGCGMPLSSELVDADVIAQTERAIRQGQNVLLVMVDQSKSGCIAPSLSCALYLRQRFPGQVQLLLDACQFRLSRHTLQAYLKHGVMVIITGSKFLAGPSFSAALLLPRSAPVPASESPSAHSATEPGLLLRWQVALASWQALQRLDDLQIGQFLQQCADVIGERLTNDGAFSPLSVPGIDRCMDITDAGWDAMPTIFPFMLCLPSRSTSPGYAGYADTLAIYQHLQQAGNSRIQLGRPIHAGFTTDGRSIGALRLCISVPMIVHAINHKKQESVIHQVVTALDQVSDTSK